MSRVKLARNSFNSGEIDPLISARFDVRAHSQGAGTLKNVVCLPQGGIRRRGGLEFLDTRESDARLVPFAFSTTQAYLLVFVHLRMYVYKDGVLVTNINASGNDYLTTPWSLTQILEAGWTQSADTLIVCHNGHAQRSITRGGSDSTWTIATIGFKFQPVEDFNSDYDAVTFTLSSSAVGTGRTLTASSAVFTAEHVGGRFEGRDGVADITAFGSGTSVTIDIIEAFVNTTVQGNRAYLAEPVWTSEHGYPQAVTFHEGRLWFAATTSQPQTLWGSVTNDFFNFDFGTGLDDEGIGVTIDTEQVNEILHLVSMRHLQIMTSGGEFFLPDSPITPSKSTVKRQTNFGSSNVRPTTIDGTTHYVQRTGKVVREYLFDFVEDAYKSNSASLLASHLINTPKDMAAQRGSSEQDANYVYLINENGTASVYNSLREQEVSAWSQWDSIADFRRVAVVNDAVYFLMEYDAPIEFDAGEGGEYNDWHLVRLDNDRFTDLFVYNAALGSDTMAGFEHLEGKTIKVRADGSLMNDALVALGSITIERTATALEAGMGFEVEITTLPVNIDMQDGPTYADMKRIVSAYVDLYESLGVVVDGFRLPDRQFGETVLDMTPTPYTDIKRVRTLGWDRLKTITISQTDPQPLTLRSLTLEVET